MIRTRVGLAVVIGIALASLVSFVLLRGRGEERAHERVGRRAVAWMAAGGRARCERHPASFLAESRFFPRPLAVLDARGNPVAGRARIDRSALVGLEVGAVHAVGAELAIRMPWDDSPCAFVVVRRPAPPPSPIPVVVGAMALAVGLASWALRGPLNRLKRVTEAATRLGPGGLDAADRTRLAALGKDRDEVGILATALWESSGRVRDTNLALRGEREALAAYVAQTSHDLQTPITALVAHLATLEAEAREGRAPTVQELAHATGELHYLGQLVANLGALARTGTEGATSSGALTIEGVVERVVERHRPLAVQRGIELAGTSTRGLVVCGDELLLERAISNLVHNAVRHHEGASSPGHVSVLATARGDEVRVDVMDDGGASERAVAAIEDALAGRTRPASGARRGLGLEVVRRVVAHHGARVEVTRTAEGLTVALILSRRESQDPHGRRDAPSESVHSAEW